MEGNSPKRQDAFMEASECAKRPGSHPSARLTDKGISARACAYCRDADQHNMCQKLPERILLPRRSPWRILLPCRSLLISGLSNDNYMWKALSPGHFCWQSFPNQKAHTDFLEDIYAWSGMNFIWTRDMFMCTKRRITQDLLAASQSKPELSGERQLVFKDTVA